MPQGNIKQDKRVIRSSILDRILRGGLSKEVTFKETKWGAVSEVWGSLEEEHPEQEVK